MAKKYIYNSLGFNGEDRVSSVSDIQRLRTKSIEIRCLVDDFFEVVKKFSNIEDKTIKYHVAMADNIRITNFRNMFNTLSQLIEY